jgi:hypothetical protein
MEEYLIQCFKVWDTEHDIVRLLFEYHKETQLYSKNLELEVTRYIYAGNDVEERLEKLRCCITDLHRLYNISKDNHEKYLHVFNELNFNNSEITLSNFDSFVNREYNRQLQNVPLWFLQDQRLTSKNLDDANDLLCNILTLHDSYRPDEIQTYEENLENFKNMLRPFLEDNLRFNHSMSMLLYHYYNQLYSIFTKIELYIRSIIYEADSDVMDLEEGEVVSEEEDNTSNTNTTTMFTYAKIQVIN